MTLILASTKRYFGFGDKDNHVVLDGGRVIGRIFQQPQAPEGFVVLDNHCARASAINPQSRLFRDARRSDDGIQSAVASAADLTKLDRHDRMLVQKVRSHTRQKTNGHQRD